MKLRFRLWLTFSLLVVIICTVIYIGIINVYEARTMESQKQLVISQGYGAVDKIRGTLPRAADRTDGYLSFYSDQLNSRLLILNHEKQLWFDSAKQLQPGAPLSLAILNEGEVPAGLFIPTSSYGYVQYTLLPLDEAVDLGYLLIINNVDYLYEDIFSFRLQVIFIMMASVFAFFFLCYGIASWFTGPINTIIQQMKRITPQRRAFKVAYSRKDEIRELATEIEHMVRQLNRYDQRQQQFLSSTSHELKTPLATMQLIVENLPHVREDSSTHHDFLSDLSVQINKMRRIVDNLMDVNRMAEKPLEKQRLSGKDLEKHIREHFQWIAEEKLIELNFLGLDTTIEADRDLFLRAADNLVSNALRYSDTKGRVTISLLPASGNGSAEFAVCDDGIGIPEEELPHIFEPFYRSNEASSWNQEGSGLGLTIVKQIADMHECRLLVESQSGKGTCVKLIFP
ncbi:sensor histidine kinase [Paenibacillus senegalensis]|uniref:sensor histidine kinase n=1 Tax=Paenibacillus senegalensis TaxID=1465766 RepID=UPI000288CE1D|nr:HAMP domain-containing sensor histidine kinase [Paenibacillus senegalensis]